MNIASRNAGRLARTSRRRGVAPAIWLAAALLIAAPLLTPRVRADVTAFQFADMPAGASSAMGNDGFRFQPSRSIRVTALGYYDRDQNGLALQHPTGIFDVASGQLLASATVGPGSTLDGLFRYTPIAPLLLDASRTYEIAGFHPGSFTDDLAAYGPVPVLIAPDINYQGYFNNYSSQLSLPTTVSGTTGFFGPNFKYQVVPEPGWPLAAALAMPSLLARRRVA